MTECMEMSVSVNRCWSGLLGSIINQSSSENHSVSTQ